MAHNSDEHNMNGALVIPNLMCINFYALKINKMGQLVAGPGVR